MSLIRIVTGVWVNPEHIISAYTDPNNSGKVRVLTTAGEYLSFAGRLSDVIQKLGGDPKRRGMRFCGPQAASRESHWLPPGLRVLSC